MKCKWQGINHHRTTDAVSSGAAKTLEVAGFDARHSVVCNCMASNGTIRSEDCDGLRVFDGDNVEVARFTGKQFSAQQSEDGSILVYAMPTAQTQDSNTRCGDMAAHGLAAHGERLAGINRANADFWARRNAEE